MAQEMVVSREPSRDGAARRQEVGEGERQWGRERVRDSREGKG